MREQKGFLTYVANMVEQYRADRHSAPSGQSAPPLGRLHRFLHWMMPNGGTLLLVLVLILTQQVWARPLQQQVNVPGPSATTVNYQGRLADAAGNPLDGTYGMSFALFAIDTGGSPVWGPENHPAVPVSGGLFSVGLGSQMSGGIPATTWNGDRYLEITVGGETLSPRELIRAVPIAGMALTVPDGAIGTAQVADGAIGTAQVADGSITSNDLHLAHGKVCLTSHVSMALPAGHQNVEIPGLSMTLDLDRPSDVLVWMDGLIKFDQAGAGDYEVLLFVDGEWETGSIGWDDDRWSNVKGQRVLNLSSGTHSMVLKGGASFAGTLTVHGGTAYYACLNYLVLGEP